MGVNISMAYSALKSSWKNLWPLPDHLELVCSPILDAFGREGGSHLASSTDYVSTEMQRHFCCQIVQLLGNIKLYFPGFGA